MQQYGTLRRSREIAGDPAFERRFGGLIVSAWRGVGLPIGYERDDCVQDTRMKLLMSDTLVHNEESFVTRAARNLAIDRSRQQQSRHTEVSLVGPNGDDPRENELEYSDRGRIAHGIEWQTSVCQILFDGKTPLRQEDMRVLWLISEGHSQRQVARRLKVSDATMSRRVRLLKKKVVELISSLDGRGGSGGAGTGDGAGHGSGGANGAAAMARSALVLSALLMAPAFLEVSVRRGFDWRVVRDQLHEAALRCIDGVAERFGPSRWRWVASGAVGCAALVLVALQTTSLPSDTGQPVTNAVPSQSASSKLQPSQDLPTPSLASASSSLAMRRAERFQALMRSIATDPAATAGRPGA